MRGTRAGLGWLSGLLLCAAGCFTTEPSLKPPPHPEELAVPPQDDPRFSAPVEYPKGTLNNDLLMKPDSDPNKFPDPSRFGTGPGTRSSY
jgi:hypothetical protein